MSSIFGLGPAGKEQIIEDNLTRKKRVLKSVLKKVVCEQEEESITNSSISTFGIKKEFDDLSTLQSTVSVANNDDA